MSLNKHDFRILIITENSVSRSYCGYQQHTGSAHEPPVFINSDADGKGTIEDTFTYAWAGSGSENQVLFTTSEIGLKLRSMVSCSFIDKPWIPGGTTAGLIAGSADSAKTFQSHETGIEVVSSSVAMWSDPDTKYASDTGSVTFQQKLTETSDPIKKIKFWGSKVADTLGLPENAWMYFDSLRADISEDDTHLGGDVTSETMTVLSKLTLANSGEVGGHFNFKVYNTTSDKFLRFIDSRAGNNFTNKILIGYQNLVDPIQTDYLVDPKDNFKIATTGHIGAGHLIPQYPLHVEGYSLNDQYSYNMGKIAAYFMSGSIWMNQMDGTATGSAINFQVSSNQNLNGLNWYQTFTNQYKFDVGGDGANSKKYASIKLQSNDLRLTTTGGGRDIILRPTGSTDIGKVEVIESDIHLKGKITTPRSPGAIKFWDSGSASSKVMSIENVFSHYVNGAGKGGLTIKNDDVKWAEFNPTSFTTKLGLYYNLLPTSFSHYLINNQIFSGYRPQEGWDKDDNPSWRLSCASAGKLILYTPDVPSNFIELSPDLSKFYSRLHIGPHKKTTSDTTGRAELQINAVTSGSTAVRKAMYISGSGVSISGSYSRTSHGIGGTTLLISGSGYVADPVFKVDGNSGSLFEVYDDYEDSYFSVSDISGVPLIDVKKNEGMWINASLLSNWDMYTADSNYYCPASYRKDPMGYVMIQGMISGGTASANTTLFLLPQGYRPAYTQYYAVYDESGASHAVSVHPSGEVKLGYDAGNVDTTWLSLAGIFFYAGHANAG